MAATPALARTTAAGPARTQLVPSRPAPFRTDRPSHRVPATRSSPARRARTPAASSAARTTATTTTIRSRPAKPPRRAHPATRSTPTTSATPVNARPTAAGPAPIRFASRSAAADFPGAPAPKTSIAPTKRTSAAAAPVTPAPSAGPARRSARRRTRPSARAAARTLRIRAWPTWPASAFRTPASATNGASLAAAAGAQRLARLRLRRPRHRRGPACRQVLPREPREIERTFVFSQGREGHVLPEASPNVHTLYVRFGHILGSGLAPRTFGAAAQN